MQVYVLQHISYAHISYGSILVIVSVHRYVRAYTHACTLAMHTYIHAFMHTCVCTHVCMHTCMHALACARMCAPTRARMSACTHMCILYSQAGLPHFFFVLAGWATQRSSCSTSRPSAFFLNLGACRRRTPRTRVEPKVPGDRSRPDLSDGHPL